jgi:hypothetical protein
MLKRQLRTNNHGASLALVAVFGFLLVACIYAAVNLSFLFGASQEARNAVDAGALNAAKRSIEIKTPPEGVFSDVADTTGGIGLSNINRVWGKALLINANVQSMQTEGQSGNSAVTNGQAAYKSATQINDALKTQLVNVQTMSNFFNQIAGQRNVKMLGNAGVNAQIKAEWTNALLDRGAESNISAQQGQIPTDANVNVSLVGGKYLPGYQPITINGQAFYFVPFRVGEKPHLVGSSYFESNRSDVRPLPGITNAVPNSFSASGVSTTESGTANSSSGSTNSQSGMIGASAYAIANPQRQYNLAIPHAYISIQISNMAKWFVEGAQVNMTPYGVAKQTVWGVQMALLKSKAKLNGYASLGNEYENKSLWAAINSVPEDPTVILQKMTQRLQEIQPSFSQAQLVGLLTSQQVVPQATQYLIFPQYSGEDTSNPTITIQPVTGRLPSWLVVAYPPDGIEKGLVTSGKVRDQPNYDWQQIIGGSGSDLHFTEMYGTLNWEPDSGYNQCLGQIRISHTTECHFAAEPGE